jgi:hypothetical protein
MTKKAAIYVAEKKEQSAKEQARLRRKPQKDGTQEEKEENRVERAQQELAIMLHNRKLREQRKETKRHGTLERARQGITWETRTIRGLDNQSLDRKVSGRANESSMEQVTAGSSSGGTESQGSTKVKHADVIVKNAETGTGFTITKYLFGVETEQPFPVRGSKMIKNSQPTQTGANPKSATL